MTTMPVPALPLPIQVELFAAGDWRDVSADVYQRQDIQIQHGLSNETTSVQPSSCSLLLGNTSGNYDPANPTGLYFGTIGMNTPLRVSLLSHVDLFGRTVASGWGTAPDGDVWSTFGTGAASVTPGTAKHALSANQFVVSNTTAVWGDVDVAVTVDTSLVAAPTGAAVGTGIVLRGVSTAFYYATRVQYQTDGTLAVEFFDAGGGVIVPLTAITSPTQSAATLRILTQIERTTIRLKVWDPSGAEPISWNVTQTFNRGVTGSVQGLRPPGFVGIRTDVLAGNTNGTVTFSFSNFVVRVPKYAGNAFLQPTADLSLKDKTVTVTAGGPLRAMAQGQQQLQSPLTHDIPTALAASLLAYWPCEDQVPASAASGAIGFSSGLPDGQVMAIASGAGNTQFAADSAFAGSTALPINNGSYWIGYTGSTATDGTFQVRWLIHWPPAATLIDGTVPLRVHCTGSALRWDLVYHAGGSLDVIMFDNQGNTQSMGSIAFAVDGTIMRMALWAQQSGSNISCQLSTYVQEAGFASFQNFTITGESFGTCYAVAVNPPANALTSTSVGQISVEQIHAGTSVNIFDLAPQFNGFPSEAADKRVERVLGYLGYDTGIEFATGTFPMLCGQQQLDSAFSIAQLASNSDGGLLYDSKGDGQTIMFVSGSARIWTPGGDRIVVALDVAQHHLSQVPTPTYDDQIIHNDITGTNWDGTNIQQSLPSGPMSTANPPNGVGDYPTSMQVSLQTQASVADRVGWELSQGTNPSPRYPQIAVNLLRKGNDAIYWPIQDVRPDSFVSLAGWTPDLLVLLARGYTETLGAFNHQLVFNTAPGDRYAVPQLDDGQSRLAAGNSALASPVTTTTATSLSVKSNDGTLWTTASADRPFDVFVGGERMTVTNVTGTSSPQTCTVTRAVNGVHKTHLANEQVQIANPVYLSLGRD